MMNEKELTEKVAMLNDALALAHARISAIIGYFNLIERHSDEPIEGSDDLVRLKIQLDTREPSKVTIS